VTITKWFSKYVGCVKKVNHDVLRIGLHQIKLLYSINILSVLLFMHLLPSSFCHITGILECIPFEKPSSSKSVKQELYCRTKFTAQNMHLGKNS